MTSFNSIYHLQNNIQHGEIKYILRHFLGLHTCNLFKIDNNMDLVEVCDKIH